MRVLGVAKFPGGSAFLRKLQQLRVGCLLESYKFRTMEEISFGILASNPDFWSPIVSCLLIGSL